MADGLPPTADTPSRLAAELALLMPLLPTYLHLILSALFPIYTGAHASLGRPSSAAPADKKDKSTSQDEDEDSDDEEEQKMEGLRPSDAIIFPAAAGCTLAGLYFLIKWLEDPAILNKILNLYFAGFAVFSVARIISDALDVATAFVFPRRYADQGVIWHVHQKERQATAATVGVASERTSPLPGRLSRLALPPPATSLLWTLRGLSLRKWRVDIHLPVVGNVKTRFGLHTVVGAIAALTCVLYFNLVDKPWFLTNLMGFGFSYNAMQLMSPTTFATGSLILGALFCYDIYFVFYTPMMVTVAKTLDIPIKLIFPKPSIDDPTLMTEAMLGLGDVVLPGIMIGLALRFDIHMFYLRKQRLVSSSRGPNLGPNQSDPSANTTSSTSQAATKTHVVKAPFHPISNRYGEHFWLHSWTGRPLVAPRADVSHPPTTFPKTYFNAALLGYIVGMLATLGVMQVFSHAQPALLYLVPGVVGAIWGTAVVRGEIKEVWGFSEVADEDEAEGKKEDEKGDKGSKDKAEEKKVK